MKRFFSLLFAAVLTLSLLPVTLLAEETGMNSLTEADFPDPTGVGSAIVYNVENQMPIYTHNADKVVPTASFTKMMTALCAYEALSERLEETLTVAYSQIKDATGNRVGYYVGETVTVRDLFGGLLVRGANDSAYLLGYLADGDIEAFLARMNRKAEELGMASTTYKNPTGMTENGMVTTAEDCVKLALAFYEQPFLTSLSGGVKYEMPATNKSVARTLYNRNGLASRVVENGYFDSRLLGLNAGSTVEAGYYAASVAAKEELSYIILVLAAEEIDGVNRAYAFSSALATYAFRAYTYTEVIRAGRPICEVPVTLSTDSDYVMAVSASALTLYLPSAIEPSRDLTYSARLDRETVAAPITEGDRLGVCVILNGEQPIGEVELVARNSLARSEFLAALDSIEKFTSSTFFLVFLLTAVLLFCGVLLAQYLQKRRRRRHYRYRRR